MYEPSLEAKYFCSLTRKRIERMKLAPACIAEALTSRRRSTFSLIGTSIEFLTIGVDHDTSPTPFVGASCTGVACMREFAFAIEIACFTALATESESMSLVAEKPQVPFAMTRMPTPDDSVLTTF